MDTSAIAAASTALNQAKQADAVHVAVLKKALDLSGQSALQLIQAASAAAPSNPAHLANPAHLGSLVDIRA